MKKRILSMLVVLTIVISLIVVPNSTVTAATYYDTVDTDCELAVDVLSALGIMGGYTDGSFLPYNTITKAEMAAIAVKLAGINEYISEVPDDMELFNDMYDYQEEWAASVIAIAKTAGIARSDAEGNFNPDMSATYEDAVQMVVSALGYGHQAQSRGDTLLDYVYVGQRLGITKKLNTGIGNNITRADVAKLVYAALTVDIMEAVSYTDNGTMVTYRAVEGRNALNAYFDVYEVSGIIAQTEYAAIDGETTIEEEQVLINGEAFDVGYTDISNYLGYYATIYALDDDENLNGRTIIAYNVKSVKNNVMTLDPENISDVYYSAAEGYRFEYWMNKDTARSPKTLRTSSTPKVLYNGKAVIDVSIDLLKPKFGEVNLIDNNGDDRYDIVDIWEYSLVYVVSASQVSGNVSGYYDSATTYRFDPASEDYHVTFLNANGGMAQLSDIKQRSVLYVYESLDKQEKKVVISNGKTSGSVTELGEDVVVINNVEYEISPAAKGRVVVAISDNGEFYLDADNRIAGFNGKSVIRYQPGMFIAVNDGGIRRGYQMKLVTANSGVQIIDIASAVKVNDTTMTASDIYKQAYTDVLFGKNVEDTNLTNAGLTRANPSRAGFLYKLNDRGQICEMIVFGDGEDGDGYLQRRKIRTLPPGNNNEKTIYYNANYKCIHFSEETCSYNGTTVGMRTYCDETTVNFIYCEANYHTNDNDSFKAQYVTTYWDNYNFKDYDFCWAYYYSPDGDEVDMQKTVCNFLVMADWYYNPQTSSDDTDQNVDAHDHQPNVLPKFIHKITTAYDKATEEDTFRVYYFDGPSLRNSLVRPQYKKVAYVETGVLYPEGFPVKISTDGAYIEDIAPYFKDSISNTVMKNMVTPIYNATTETNILPIQSFYASESRPWNDWSSNWNETEFYSGIVTSIDEVVGRKIFSVAVNSGGVIKSLLNEKLEGTVYRLDFDRDGNIGAIKTASLDDIAPGQMVLVRKYYYDAPAKRYGLTTYELTTYIISDDASELDYITSTPYYDKVQAIMNSAR